MLKIDNCKYCAALTLTNYTDLHRLIQDIERGDMGCWLCDEDGDHHEHFDIFDGKKKVWCGHNPRCTDMEGNT